MIIEEVLELLDPLEYNIYPFGTYYIEDCVIYNFIPVSSDKIKEQHKLELTVISKDYKNALEMMENIKEKLLTLGDEKKGSNILEIALNGGGSLENLETKTFHVKAFFIVKNRYRRD